MGNIELIGLEKLQNSTLQNRHKEILTPQALTFLAELQTQFNPRREELLKQRISKDDAIEHGEPLRFLPETEKIRKSDWKVAEAPKDLNDRRVEITGPVERKMMINALNSGAKVFMADFEDANSPTWANCIDGQVNCFDAVRRTLDYKSPEGKAYQLNPVTATLVIRPRGWHMTEKHALFEGKPMSASLFDFGLYFFHNAKELLSRGSGPYFYLPKMESHLEARLWNDVFTFAQKKLGIPHGSVRATCLIETINAAFEMDEFLYELKDHAAGLNAGRWDYIFSCIKKFRNQSNLTSITLPDRGQITMSVPFMRAYTELLVKTCHRRGAHAIGGMAAFIPSRKDAVVNANAISKVQEDKNREAGSGFDGTWVAHPDLVPVAKAVFDGVLKERPNQKERLREEVNIQAEQLTQFEIPGATLTEAGVRNNINVALQYIESWMRGLGAVAIHNLMEDAATAEISRSQLWLWVQQEALLMDGPKKGQKINKELYLKFKNEEISKLGGENQATPAGSKLKEASALLDRLVLDADFLSFLTLPAYQSLDV